MQSREASQCSLAVSLQEANKNVKCRKTKMYNVAYPPPHSPSHNLSPIAIRPLHMHANQEGDTRQATIKERKASLCNILIVLRDWKWRLQ